MYRSPGICLTVEENPGKPQLGETSVEVAGRPVIASNGVPYLRKIAQACLGISSKLILNISFSHKFK